MNSCKRDYQKEEKLLPKPAAVTFCLPSPQNHGHVTIDSVGEHKRFAEVKQAQNNTLEYGRLITNPSGPEKVGIGGWQGPWVLVKCD